MLTVLLILSVTLVFAGNSTTIDVSEDDTFYVTWRYARGVEIEQLNQEYLDGETPNGFGSLEPVDEITEE